jgi:hypothetical protein
MCACGHEIPPWRGAHLFGELCRSAHFQSAACSSICSEDGFRTTHRVACERDGPPLSTPPAAKKVTNMIPVQHTQAREPIELSLIEDGQEWPAERQVGGVEVAQSVAHGGAEQLGDGQGPLRKAARFTFGRCTEVGGGGGGDGGGHAHECGCHACGTLARVAIAGNVVLRPCV